MSCVQDEARKERRWIWKQKLLGEESRHWASFCISEFFQGLSALTLIPTFLWHPPLPLPLPCLVLPLLLRLITLLSVLPYFSFSSSSSSLSSSSSPSTSFLILTLSLLPFEFAKVIFYIIWCVLVTLLKKKKQTTILVTFRIPLSLFTFSQIRRCSLNIRVYHLENHTSLGPALDISLSQSIFL